MDSTANSPSSSELNEMFENLSSKISNNESIISINTTSSSLASSTPSTSRNDRIGSGVSMIVHSSAAQSYRALRKIINFMRKRYQSDKGVEPLTLDEIFVQTNQTDLNVDVKEWLSKEALPNNKRIEVSENGDLYQFMPPLKLQNLDDLTELLKEYDRKGLGGILIDDIRDSLPNYRQVLKNCDRHVLLVKRPFDRKSIVYYADNEEYAATNFELQAMWRSLGLEDIEEVSEPSDQNGHF